MRSRVVSFAPLLVVVLAVALVPSAAGSHADPFTCIDDASGSFGDVNCMVAAAKCILREAPFDWLLECWHFLGP